MCSVGPGQLVYQTSSKTRKETYRNHKVSVLQPTAQCCVRVSALLPIVSISTVGPVDHVSSDGLDWRVPADQNNTSQRCGLDVGDSREACTPE